MVSVNRIILGLLRSSDSESESTEFLYHLFIQRSIPNPIPEEYNKGCETEFYLSHHRQWYTRITTQQKCSNIAEIECLSFKINRLTEMNRR